MNRTKAREYAFVLLFEYKFQPDEMERILKDFVEEFNPGDQQGYIERVVGGVIENVEEIDGIIQDVSKDWTTERMSNVCLALMRLAVYEIKFCEDIPSVVAVNEAVALAKKYDGEESTTFVNGILGKISNE